MLLSAIQSLQGPPAAGAEIQAVPAAKAEARSGDSLELSPQAVERSRQAKEPAKALPIFGRFELGGPEPIPYGPDLKASILNRIPGDGVRESQHGVELGHQPARGLNILA